MLTNEMVQKRTYGPVFKRNALDSPSTEKPFTPAEEFSSWLPDEVCIACGAQTATRQLFCSDECRKREEQSNQSTTGESVLQPYEGLQSSQLNNRARSTSPSKRAASAPFGLDGIASSADCSEAFRYHCPTSPQLLAYRKASVSALTSVPAFDSSILARRTKAGGLSQMSRTDANQRRTSSGRRGSSDSGSSSNASSSAFMTDPSTPSPALAPAQVCSVAGTSTQKSSGHELASDGDDDDVDSGSGSDFRLPPSVNQSTAVVMNKQQAPITSSKISVHGLTSRSNQTNYPTMTYARRPSSTNLPAPVVYSPALLAKSAKASPVFFSERARASPFTRSASRRPRRSCGGGDDIEEAPGLHTKSQSVVGSQTPASEISLAKILSSPATNAAPTEIEATATTFSCMSRARSDPMPLVSPSHHSADGSSPSTKTLMATRSPRSRGPSTVEVCGRRDCVGTSIPRQGSFTTTDISVSPKSAALANKTRHRHTHSAQASLSHTTTHSETLRQMNVAPLTTVALPASFRRSSVQFQHEPESVTPISQSRGRSKARGRRSISRRSRSPPRAAARGQSDALLSEEKMRKMTHPTSPPLASVKPTSQPVEISKATVSLNDSSSITLSSVDRASSSQAGDEEDASHETVRRGRSPIERLRRLSRLDARAAKHSILTEKPCAQPSSRSVESRQTRGRGPSRVDLSAAVTTDPGFDDVENLEIED